MKSQFVLVGGENGGYDIERKTNSNTGGSNDGLSYILFLITILTIAASKHFQKIYFSSYMATKKCSN